MEKLLIIGASIGQVPLVKKAKSKGIHVTVATIPGKYPCINLADDVIYLDIYNRDGIVEEAKKRRITAVTSDQNDLVNPTVAYISEKLNLPGNKYDTVMNYCNKNRFRNLCKNAGVPVPRHIEINNEIFDYGKFECSLPWIVKPADSQSSIGVQRIDSFEQIEQALKYALRKSPTHSAILEEFFVGKEIVCEGFIENGKYHLLGFADRKYFNLKDLFIPSQTIFPSVIEQKILKQIVEFERTLAAYTNPAFAIVHSEYLVNDKTGDIRIVESALRGGGVYISSDLIPIATGIDINEVLLKKVMDEDIDVEDIFSKRDDKAAGYVCFYLPNGVVQEINGIEKLNQLSSVHKEYINGIEVGKSTEKMTYKGARKGPILVKGQNRDDIERNIKEVQDTLDIKVLDSSGKTSGIIWS